MNVFYWAAILLFLKVVLYDIVWGYYKVQRKYRRRQQEANLALLDIIQEYRLRATISHSAEVLELLHDIELSFLNNMDDRAWLMVMSELALIDHFLSSIGRREVASPKVNWLKEGF